MTEKQAEMLATEIEKFCKENKIWYSKVVECKPELSIIRFTDISIKVTKK